MLTICSVVTAATRAQARAMTSSAKRHHPDARVLVHLQGPLDDPGAEDFEVAELSEATPCELLEHALIDAEIAIYLDPQVYLYDSLQPIMSAATERGVAVVPRAGSLPEDGMRPDDSDLLAEGDVSPALVAVARGEAAGQFLGWWSRQSRRSDVADGRWLSLARDRFAFVATVSDPGTNVSFWNLHERPLELAEGKPVTSGRPLRSIHFAGFRPDRPYWLSDQATRVQVLDDPLLSELCGGYAEEVREAGWSPPRAQIGDLSLLGNGQRVDSLVRALWTQALEDGHDFGDPLTGTAADEFVAWMRAPDGRGGKAGVSRYLYATYLHRPDLQQAFPDLEGPDGQRLVSWGLQQGQEVLGELVTPLRDGGELHEDGQLGVNVIGYLGETLGLAEAARLYIRALDAAGVSVTTTAISPDLPIDRRQKSITRYGSHAYQDRFSSIEPSFNLACLNGDHLAALVRREGSGILEGRPTIGQWGWETDVLPPSWSEAFPLVDEVWVYSRFMAENLGRLLPMPVVVVPPAVVAPDPSGAELDIATDERFTFVFMLDLFSTLRRKNATGLVEAFIRAFAPDEGPRLIVKTINARFREQAAQELRFHIGDRPDIELIDRYLDPGQKAALLARADCYVSLHRSEGFGLPLAESMSLRTPVIATGYSGNLDFMTPQNSYLVDWAPSRVGSDSEIYPAHGTWAEPDLDHAAELMRWVFAHPEEASAKGERAQADIERDYAPKVTGAIARARLEHIRAGGPGRSSTRVGEDLQRVQRSLTFDLRQGAPPVPSGAAGLLRRSILRLMLPFTYHQREVDRGLLAAVWALRSELEAERAQGRRYRRRLNRLEDSLQGSGTDASAVATERAG